MRLLFVLALGLTSAARDLDTEWELFKKTYNKVYVDANTEQFRRSVWEYHLGVIEKHNAEADRGLHSFHMGVNQFADMPNFEFRRLMTGFLMRNDSAPRGTDRLYRKPDNMAALPDEVDWRKEGYVTPVKNQGNCGSCWSFSANGALEGQWFKKSGDLIRLSEQNLMDCSVDEGNLGCLGGRMDFAWDYVIKNDGEDTEESYPYEEMDGLPCRFKRADVGATVTGYKYIDFGDEEAQKAAVAEVGPLAVAMDALQLSFQLYRSGVYYDPRCSSTVLNHAVTAIGYGTTSDGDDYWLIKNSWGTGWGEEGFARMARNRDNNCGIATDSLFPTV